MTMLMTGHVTGISKMNLSRNDDGGGGIVALTRISAEMLVMWQQGGFVVADCTCACQPVFLVE